MTSPLQEQHKQTFVTAARTSTAPLVPADEPFEETLPYATFSGPVPAARVAEAVAILRALSLYMHVVTVAEAAVLQADHLDGSLPALTEKECREYRETFTEFRDDHLKELKRYNIRIDLDAYTQNTRTEVFRSQENPCRALQDLVRSVYRRRGYEI